MAGRRPTLRGMMKVATGKRNPLSQKIYRASPKGVMRRKARKALGMPTTAKGWNSSSRAFYRNHFGCVTILIEAIGIIALFAFLFSLI